jgi:hypothetical protein
MLKNLHNIAAPRFPLKAEEKFLAIYCDYKWAPHFHEMNVLDQCNANSNEPGLDGRTFFTGSRKFTAKEIEVFEITD